MVIISALKNHPRMSFLKSCEGNIAQLLHSHLALELESSYALMCMKIYGLSTVSVHTPTGQWDLVGYSMSCIITAPSRQTSCRPPLLPLSLSPSMSLVHSITTCTGLTPPPAPTLHCVATYTHDHPKLESNIFV